MKKNLYFKILSVILSIIIITPFFPVLKIDADFENTHINTGNQREDIVAVAKTQIGYIEGANNETKYNHWLGSLDGFPANGYGYAWCQSFVSWCAYQANIPNSIILRNSGTVTVKDFFINNGTYHKGPYEGGSYTPKRGDIIYFYSSAADSKHHVGIVSDCKDGMVYTIEGNTGEYPNRVCEGSYPVTYGNIRGYGVPNYDDKNPPGWADVKISRAICPINENVTFSLSSDTGTSYTVGIDYEYANGTRERMDTYNTVDNFYTRKFNTAGNYSCYITTYNEYGLADSGRIYFTIYDSKPGYAKIKLSKKIYDVGENVKFLLSSDTGGSYTVGIDDASGKRIDTYNTAENYYTRTFSTPGDYSCYITTYNEFGLADSEKIYFSIINPNVAPDKPNPKISKTVFTTNEKVDIIWDKVKNTTSYWLHIYKDGKDYVNKSLNSDLSYSATYPAGNYTAYIVSCNSSGETLSYVEFSVYDIPDIPVVTLDSVTENSATIKWKSISGATGYKITFRSSSDDKYEVIENNYTSTSYTKKDLTPGTKYYFRVYAFNEGGQSAHSETIAAKTLNAVTIHYNVNGGTIASDSKYYAEKNGDVYIVSSKKILAPVWADGAKFKNGLYNASSFKLTKEGYKFLGWSTKKSGGTIFDQNDSNVSANDLFPEIKEKCGTITLYAQWEVVYTPEDINEDGKTTIADLLLMKKYMLSKNTDSSYLQNMDLNNNKEIDVFDIIILKHLLISN